MDTSQGIVVGSNNAGANSSPFPNVTPENNSRTREDSLVPHGQTTTVASEVTLGPTVESQSRFSGYDSPKEANTPADEAEADGLLPLRIKTLGETVHDTMGEPNLPARSPLRELHRTVARRRVDISKDRLQKYTLSDVTSQSLESAPKNRHEKIKARKLRDLYEVRDSMTEVLKRCNEEQSASKAAHSDKLQPKHTAAHHPPRLDSHRTSPEYITGYTPVTGQSLSPVMLIAEKIEVPRGKQVRKPVPLILRDPSPLRTTTKAFRPGTPPPSPPSSVLPVPSELKENAQKVSNGGGTSNRPISHSARPHKDARYFVPGRSASGRSAIVSRSSICSSHTSASKETRLEARVDALERENKLLEAALMAVLKTSGTLNKCPCVLNKQRRTQEKRMSEDSAVTDISGLSALDIYMNTRHGPCKGLSPVSPV
jgi:hypothetical protein